MASEVETGREVVLVHGVLHDVTFNCLPAMRLLNRLVAAAMCSVLLVREKPALSYVYLEKDIAVAEARLDAAAARLVETASPVFMSLRLMAADLARGTWRCKDDHSARSTASGATWSIDKLRCNRVLGLPCSLQSS